MNNYEPLFAALDVACDEIMNKIGTIQLTYQLSSIHNIYKAAIQSTFEKNLKIRLLISLYKKYTILFPRLIKYHGIRAIDKAINGAFSDTMCIQYDEIPTMQHINEKLVDDMIREFDIFRTLINNHYQVVGLPQIPIHPTTTCDDSDSDSDGDGDSDVYVDEFGWISKPASELNKIKSNTGCISNTTSKVKVDTHETKLEEVSPTTRPRRNIPIVNYKGTC